MVSDNGLQFGSKEFVVFAKTWGFTHVTSSPCYPQSNGKAENTVKTVKRLFTKCHKSCESEYLALLDWRNTPFEGLGTSPAQHFLGRRCRTLLPTTTSRLQLAFPTDVDVQACTHQRQCQQVYYDKHAKPLKPIPVGETMRLRLPGQATRSTGTCKGLVGTRSYDVQVGERIYRRNRRQLIYANEPLLTSPPIVDQLPTEQSQSPNQFTQNSNIDSTTTPQEVESHGPKTNLGSNPPLPITESQPHRSGRITKTPKWMEDYVPSRDNVSSIPIMHTQSF